MSKQGFDFVGQTTIGGESTDIMFHKFGNRTTLFITQYGKLANIFTIKNQIFSSPGNNRQKVYEITPRFSSAEQEVEGAVRYLANFISCEDFVISLTLKKYNKNNLVELKNYLSTISNIPMTVE